MSEHLVRQLHHIRRDLAEKTLALQEYLLRNPDPELEKIMSLVDDINALGVRINAVAAILPTDVATAVAAQKSADDAANAATVQELADAQTAVTALAAKVTALETAAGIPSTPPATGLTVSPASVDIPVGSTAAVPVSVTGGSGAIAASNLPAGVTWDGSANLVPDGTQTAGTTAVTFTDSTAPTPLTGTASVVIA